MKPIFVSLHDGRRDVHWMKLWLASAALLVVSSVVATGVWYGLSHTVSLAATVLGFVIGLTIVVRMVVRALTYQAQEIEMESPVASS